MTDSTSRALTQPEPEVSDPLHELPTPATYGLERLRETRQRLMSLKQGKSGIKARLTIALIGDSWTHDSGRYASNLAKELWSTYLLDDNGDYVRAPTGSGWNSFAENNGVVYWNARAVFSGTWTTTGPGEVSPDICAGSSSEVGARIALQGAMDYTRGLSYTLFAEGGSGVVRYSWTNDDTWTTVDLSALSSGLQVIPLTDVPASGSGTFRIEVVSGSVKLYGLNIVHPSDQGIVVHKLGATGTTAQEWAAIDGAAWGEGIAALGPDLVTILHGTNDQASRTKAEFKADLLTIIDNTRAARPTADVLLIAPCENQAGRTLPMSEYADAMYEIARDERDVAFLDLQPVFGVNPEDYAAGSSRPWFNVDGIHPEPSMGGYAIVAAIARPLLV